MDGLDNIKIFVITILHNNNITHYMVKPKHLLCLRNVTQLKSRKNLIRF